MSKKFTIFSSATMPSSRCFIPHWRLAALSVAAQRLRPAKRDCSLLNGNFNCRLSPQQVGPTIFHDIDLYQTCRGAKPRDGWSNWKLWTLLSRWPAFRETIAPKSNANNFGNYFSGQWIPANAVVGFQFAHRGNAMVDDTVSLTIRRSRIDKQFLNSSDTPTLFSQELHNSK